MLTLRILKEVGWIVGLFWYYYTGVSNTVIYYKYRWAFWQILRVNVKHFERSRLNRWTVLILLYRSFKYWRLVPIWEESRRDNYCTWAMPIYKFCQILGLNIKGWARCQMKGFPEFRINIDTQRLCCWGTDFAHGMLLAFWRILCVNVKGFERSSLNCWTVVIFLYRSFEFWRLGCI